MDEQEMQYAKQVLPVSMAEKKWATGQLTCLVTTAKKHSLSQAATEKKHGASENEIAQEVAEKEYEAAVNELVPEMAEKEYEPAEKELAQVEKTLARYREPTDKKLDQAQAQLD